MADLSKIRKNGVDYNLKDTTARADIEDLKKNGTGGTVSDEKIAQAVADYMADNPVSGGNGATASTVRAIPELRLVGDTTGISKDQKVYLSYTFRDTANGDQHTG